MLADIQSKITKINAEILMTTPIDFKSKIKIRKLKDLKQRIGIISVLPVNEIDEDDMELVYQ